MTVLQYILLSMPVIVAGPILVYYFSQPNASAERDRLYRDGIKSIMNYDEAKGL